MVYARTDPGVLGFLGRALSLELTAVQQYLTLSRLLQLRGFEEMAAKFGREADDELGHARQIINRMLILGVAPNATQLRPVKLGNSLPALIAAVQSLETEVANFYEAAVRHCARIEDFDNRVFFEKLLRDERHHGSELAKWKERYFGTNKRDER